MAYPTAAPRPTSPVMVRRGGIGQEHVPGVELQWAKRWLMRGAIDGGRVEAKGRRGGP